MDLGSIFLILALFILVGLYLARPFLEKRSVSVSSVADHDVSSLLAERDRVIGALQELDFDYALQKIPEEDYPVQRGMLLQRGADVLRQLDEYQPSQSAASTAEDRLESAIAARRADAAKEPRTAVEATAARPNGNKPVPAANDDLEALIAARKRAQPGKAVGFCPKCGGPIKQADRFCPKCGEKL